LKDQAFSTFLDQNPPFELRLKMEFRLEAIKAGGLALELSTASRGSPPMPATASRQIPFGATEPDIRQ
jgi:hypothetical protein